MAAIKPKFLSIETSLYKKGVECIAGVDEAGRGCLAGPVVAASVIFPQGLKVEGLKDSKQLTPKKREKLFDIICEKALALGVGVVDSNGIDKINILKASLQAMRDAVEKMKMKPDFLLVDGIFPIDIGIKQMTIKKGDARSISIAAASIIAKVTRDRMMIEFEKEFPKFRFSIHKGYGTKMHFEEIAIHGPTPIHRMTFNPMSK